MRRDSNGYVERMTERAAIYGRISEDPRSTAQGVGRQREDCEALVRNRGWDLVGVHVDNDISALRGAQRLGYAELLRSVERGEVDRIVAYGLSRLWRSRTERAEAIGVLSTARVGVALVKGSDSDLTSAAGRMYAGVLGEFDTAESEIKAERVARAAQQRAEEGTTQRGAGLRLTPGVRTRFGGSVDQRAGRGESGAAAQPVGPTQVRRRTPIHE